MRRTIFIALMAGLLAVAMAVPALAQGKSGDSKGRAGTEVSIYVTSQNLVYDSIVKTELPMHGNFQKLEMSGPTGLQTEFGPGAPGYLGGRWWLDANDNGVQDDGDAFFICPLLGPGQTLD